MKSLSIGSLVTLFLSQGLTQEPLKVDALVIGSTPAPVVEGEEEAPPVLNLAYLRSDRNLVLGQPNWRDAFDRVAGVNHGSHQSVADQTVSSWWEEKLDEESSYYMRRALELNNKLDDADALNGELAQENAKLKADLAAADRLNGQIAQENKQLKPVGDPAQADDSGAPSTENSSTEQAEAASTT